VSGQSFASPDLLGPLCLDPVINNAEVQIEADYLHLLHPSLYYLTKVRRSANLGESLDSLFRVYLELKKGNLWFFTSELLRVVDAINEVAQKALAQAKETPLDRIKLLTVLARHCGGSSSMSGVLGELAESLRREGHDAEMQQVHTLLNQPRNLPQEQQPFIFQKAIQVEDDFTALAGLFESPKVSDQRWWESLAAAKSLKEKEEAVEHKHLLLLGLAKSAIREAQFSEVYQLAKDSIHPKTKLEVYRQLVNNPLLMPFLRSEIFREYLEDFVESSDPSTQQERDTLLESLVVSSLKYYETYYTK
jgi:hypothetical protein